MRRLIGKLLPALLLFPELLASCLLPPFDRGLSLAQVTASKMKLEAHIGPLYHWRGDLERGRHYFLPGKTFGPDRGFLLVFAASEGKVLYINHDALGGYYVAGEQSFGLINSDQNIFNYGAFVLKDDSGTDDDALLLVRPSIPLLTEQRMEYRYNISTGFIAYQYDLTAFTSPLTSPIVVGAGTFPNTSPTSDLLTILVKDGTGNYFGRVSSFAFVPSPGYAPAWTTSPSFLVPGSPAQGFYFHNQASGPRFLSVWNGSKYLNYRWDGALARISLPVSRRIEALLTTDELFVVDGDKGIVYSPTGQRKYTFPLGSLHFAYESYIGGVPTLLFSLIYWDRAGNDSEAFHINVYSLPTSNLSTLD